MTIVYTINIRT